MFPRETRITKFLKKCHRWPSEYGNIPQIFYAKPVCSDKPPLTARESIWSKKNLQGEKEFKEMIEIVGPNDYSYYVINTSVAVGAKGKNNIKMVHIRYRLIPMRPECKAPEVVYIYPHSMSELVGETEISDKIQKSAEILGNVTANQVNPFAKLVASFGYGRNLEKIRNYIMPYHVTIANAGGTGNRAMWEFYQEEGMAAIGQFDLKVYFRIPKLSTSEESTIIRDKYCIDWNVEVNRQRLVDHDIDKYNWNIKVNGRLLMDKYDTKDNTIEQDEEGNYLFWNVPVQRISHDEKDKEKIEDEKKHRKEILKMMNEEDDKAEGKKMLRPLYLLPKKN